MSVLANVERNTEGFLVRVDDWDRGLAKEIAAELGISTLTDRHWLVVDYMRETYIRTEAAPTIRTLAPKGCI